MTYYRIKIERVEPRSEEERKAEFEGRRNYNYQESWQNATAAERVVEALSFEASTEQFAVIRKSALEVM